MTHSNLKHCPRCTKQVDESYYTCKFTYCDSCIDKRRAYRKADDEHYTDMFKTTSRRKHRSATRTSQEKEIRASKLWPKLNLMVPYAIV